jgi:hypothetical protein
LLLDRRRLRFLSGVRIIADREIQLSFTRKLIVKYLFLFLFLFLTLSRFPSDEPPISRSESGQETDTVRGGTVVYCGSFLEEENFPERETEREEREGNEQNKTKKNNKETGQGLRAVG